MYIAIWILWMDFLSRTLCRSVSQTPITINHCMYDKHTCDEGRSEDISLFPCPTLSLPLLLLAFPSLSLGVGLPAERRSFWLSGLHHRVLHQEGGDYAHICTAADLPARGCSEGEPLLQQQHSEQPCCPEEERSG